MIDLDKPHRPSGQISLIPLINVIFLMLIFFMVAGTIDRPDTLKVTPPEAESGTERAESKPLTIYISQDERLAINQDLVLKPDFKASLASYLQEDQKQPITIKSDSQLPASTLLWLLESIEAAGGTNVTLTTEAGGQ